MCSYNAKMESFDSVDMLAYRDDRNCVPSDGGRDSRNLGQDLLIKSSMSSLDLEGAADSRRCRAADAVADGDHDGDTAVAGSPCSPARCDCAPGADADCGARPRHSEALLKQIKFN